MFVLMAAVWKTGVIQALLPESFATSTPMLFTVSVLVPQLVSNVPYVALVLPVLEAAAANPCRCLLRLRREVRSQVR